MYHDIRIKRPINTLECLHLIQILPPRYTDLGFEFAHAVIWEEKSGNVPLYL